MEDISLELK